ncbi:ABC transporter permease subunit (plasmid) [Mycolicibacterium aubagnense]|nr:ABC transporter permease subunit [Mycolicibacterium aubagnense]TLH64465.1 sulfonate ABC transporter permease [Mycolicibacterium aubagnense]WGI36069.1 ABC transporter permease subunit [Mycolicibacterium aubagnense]
MNWRDAAAMVLLLALLTLVGVGAHALSGSFVMTHQPAISLSPAALPGYALRTTLRMLTAMIASLVFTLTYATAAAKSRRAEMVLIPLLDVLQSVPILGYLSFTVAFFVSLFPGRILGPELAAIFAVFTSQAWNMAFSFYQSLRTLPTDLDEAARGFRFSGWQRFWRLEAPFAVPGLVWNMMMSMSGGWFFVVAAEAISVGNVQVSLPGVGSYVALAIQNRNLGAVGWAIMAMTATILLIDQILFRPMVVWAERFRYEQAAAQVFPRSVVYSLFTRASHLRAAVAPLGRGLNRAGRMRLNPPVNLPRPALGSRTRRLVDMVWFALIAAVVGWAAAVLVRHEASALHWRDVQTAVSNGGLTLLRVLVLVALASLIWVPIGVFVGLRPTLAEKVQPVAQFLAAFPANLLFPVVVFLIVNFHADPRIWLSPLMILGAQWYILFNVIAGATAFPTDFREAASSFHIHGWRWWRDVMLPGVFPFYVTGAITASGGAWNASIVAEIVSWGSTKLNGSGLGAYIADNTYRGDFPRIVLGVAVMSVMVIAMNRAFWRPLYALAERRTRLD